MDDAVVGTGAEVAVIDLASPERQVWARAVIACDIEAYIQLRSLLEVRVAKPPKTAKCKVWV
jgi:hypothetical protein